MSIPELLIKALPGEESDHGVLCGVRPAHDFYAYLIADTAKSEATLLSIFASFIES